MAGLYFVSEKNKAKISHNEGKAEQEKIIFFAFSALLLKKTHWQKNTEECFTTTKLESTFEGKKFTWKSHLQIGHSCTKPFKYWRLCAIRAYVSFWVDFHFFQDWAQPDFWQTDLFGHEKLCSVQVCLPKIISPTRNENRPKKRYTPFLHESLQ